MRHSGLPHLLAVSVALSLSACGGDSETSTETGEPYLQINGDSASVELGENGYYPVALPLSYTGNLNVTSDSDVVSFRVNNRQVEAYMGDVDFPSRTESITLTLSVGNDSASIPLTATLINDSLVRRASFRDLAKSHYDISATRQIAHNILALATERLYWESALSYPESLSLRDKHTARVDDAYPVFHEAYTAWQALSFQEDDESVWREVEADYIKEKQALASVINVALNDVGKGTGLPTFQADSSERLLPGFFYGNPDLGEGDYGAFQYAPRYAFIATLSLPAAHCPAFGV